MGGLIAARDIRKHTMIARYEGKETETTETIQSDYLMVATDVRDMSRQVLIDGHPKYGGLAGYANYAPHKTANAYFEDAARAYKKKRGKKYNTYILLMAKEDIPAGTEIRTDYDNGVTGAPFRQKLIGEGVPAAALDAIHYKRVRWEQPRGVGSAPAVID